MADNVQWIKFKVGTFDGNSFKRIKRAKIEGVMNFRDKLTAVWFELLDLAGKVNNEGLLYSNEMAFKSYDDIAIAIDRTEEEVKMCINWFIENEMLDITDNIYLISNWSKYQNVEGLEKIREQNRERQARFREKQKQVLLETKDKDFKDKDKELDKDIDIRESALRNVTVTLLDNFDIFWKNYPKKKSKGQAEKTFKKINPDEELFNKMLDAIEIQKNSKDWLKEDGKYIPYPATWLNAKGWEDEVQEDLNKQFKDFMDKEYEKTGELL